MLFISPSFLIVVARTSSTILNKSCEMDIFVLFWIFKKKLLAFQTFMLRFVIYGPHIMLKYVPSIPIVQQIFNN